MNLTHQLIIYFTVTTLILYFGPNRFLRFIPGLYTQLPVANTKQGIARGENWSTRSGRNFHAFRGIPFAKAPVGQLRFKRPQPLGQEDSWNYERDFNYEASMCTQLFATGAVFGSEDCLYLNVYSPELQPRKLLPVIVFIHGGGYSIGSGSSYLYGPHLFMEQDVVLVTIQYRLGVFGFLSLEDDNIQGNQGLWDQRAALIWVRDNIKQFGGNPNKVTLSGQSAGGMSASAHLLSPQSQGLFHRVILQSGTMLSPFTKLQSKARARAVELGMRVGCTDSDSLASCLQEVSAETLVQNAFTYESCNIRADLKLFYPNPWKPVKDSFAEEPFLPGEPRQLASKNYVNRIPVLMGFTKDDGLLFSTRFLKDPEYASEFLDDPGCFAMNSRGLERDDLTNELIQAGDELAEQYHALQDGEIVMEGFTQLLGDAVFARDGHEFSNLLSSLNHSVYRYSFSYVGTVSLADILSGSLLDMATNILSNIAGFPHSKKLGASHCDELFYLFTMFPLTNNIPSTTDVAVSNNIISWWVDFARTGRPTPATDKSIQDEEWKEVKQSKEWEYWDISESPGMKPLMAMRDRFSRWR